MQKRETFPQELADILVKHHVFTEQKAAEVALQVREAQQTAVARLARLRGFAPDFGVFAILWSLKHLIYLDIPS